MKKLIGVGIGAALLFAVVGFSFAELSEYTQVVRNRVHQGVKEAIPMSVEIDRLEVLLQKLNQQVASQKYLVAKANIGLQDAELEQERQESKSNNLLTEMKHLRGWLAASEYATIQVGCQKVNKGDISQALRHKLAAWKESSAATEACAEAVSAQKQAVVALNKQFTEWQNQRKLLGHRLEKLKAQAVAQQLKQRTTLPELDQSDLARANELADEIEKEIRIAEAQDALGTDPLDQLLDEELTDDTSSLEAEIDAILGKKTLVSNEG